MRKLKVQGLVFAAVASLTSTFAAIADDRPVVVAVNHPLQVFAERLLGDTAEAVFPVPEGVDPSFWRPSIADISLIQSADLILLNGAGFATWVDRVSLPRSRLINTSAAIKDQFIVTQSITHSHGDGGEHSHEGLASYTWLDPMLALAQAEAIAAGILRRQLAPEEDVKTRLDALAADLKTLDNQAKDVLAKGQSVPMIATHPRYQYLARRYGLTVSSLEWEAGALPNPDELADLKRMIAETEARILIWEAEPPAEAIAAATQLGVRSVVFSPLAENHPDLSYFSAFRDGIAALGEAIEKETGN